MMMNKSHLSFQFIFEVEREKKTTMLFMHIIGVEIYNSYLQASKKKHAIQKTTDQSLFIHVSRFATNKGIQV
jgi:hypothetical protein